MQKVLQKFNINDDTKSVNTSLAPHFNLRAIMSPITVEDREYISHVLYASAASGLMYTMVYTRPELSQAISMFSRYIHDPDKGHWEVVKWILRSSKIP